MSESTNASTSPPSPESPPARPARKHSLVRVALIAAAAAAAVAVIATITLVSVVERKHEAQNPFYRVVELDDDTEDPAVWGKNFPLQYDGYRRTVDMQRTRYGGSEALPRTPTQADPRSIVAQSKLEEDPRLKVLWAGYAFSVDFREERGHAYMLEDQVFTERQRVTKQPGTCLQCHGSVYVPMKKLGGGDLWAGFAKMNAMAYPEARALAGHPVSCIDCHDSQTMQLRVTRPAFMDAMRRRKAAEGVVGYDVNTMATRQEMRSFVCGQCHVEYHFAGPEKRLTFPWDKGMRADDILAYYDEVGFKDWEHAETGAPTLKAQHPEFEMWSQGVHASAGVACADCHMPYQRVGALKISDHHIQSPLLNINAACQTCHHSDEQGLRARVYTIQSRHQELRNIAMDALMDLIGDLREARTAGATDDQIAEARNLQRKAQFLLDFAEAENSSGFHASQEGSRVLGLSLDHARRGSRSLAAYWRQRGALAPAAPAAAP